MVQYVLTEQEKVLDKNNKIVLIKPFRERTNYPNDLLISEAVRSEDIQRPDLRAIENYGAFDYIGAIIDANEKDIFSFTFNDKIKYPIGEIVIG